MCFTPLILPILLTLAGPSAESPSLALPAGLPGEASSGQVQPGQVQPAQVQEPPSTVAGQPPKSGDTPPKGADEPPERARDVAPVRERFQFTTFGGSLLEDAPLVIEGKVSTVQAGGKAVVVARVAVEERLQLLLKPLDRATATGSSVTVLATPGEVVSGQRYLLFLRPFGKSRRFSVLRRIAEGDRDFAPKRRVLAQFCELNGIEDTTKRAIAIRDALLENLDDEVLFVRWNAHAELSQFIPRHRQLFEREERAKLAEVYRNATAPTFRRGVGELLKAVGVDLDGVGGVPR